MCFAGCWFSLGANDPLDVHGVLSVDHIHGSGQDFCGYIPVFEHSAKWDEFHVANFGRSQEYDKRTW